MAHIISCMADADEPFTFDAYIAKPASPQPQNDSVTSPPPGTCVEKQSFAWRMFQPEGRKYQLFPKGGQPASKGLDPEQAFAHAISQSPKTEKSDKLSAATNGLRLRIKEHNLSRRRKISVPDLGPMTTVQETSMDSPTIPGRPALHERSISAPGSSWKHNQLDRHFRFNPMGETTRPGPSPDPEGKRLGTSAPEQTLSSRQLAPLVIPSQQGPAPKLSKQISLSRLRSGSTPVDGTQARSAKTDESPRSRTPLSSAAIHTPISAPLAESRASPHPWEFRAGSTTPTQNLLERAATPKTDEPRSAGAVIYGHRRGYSESASAGIMDRGRPKKRPERTVPNFSFNPAASLQRTDSKKRSKSAERKNFEQLPTGWRAGEVSNSLSPGEISDLQKQAFGQAARFEVLRKGDVEALSRELRHLDERTEYLRRTYTSLRAGRRNLHSRICQYLRSPRVAKFSHDSMLKQEEALAELDASIDDWVTKLEKAENRRTRVRQKLLEHVAAAATLPASGAVAASESLQMAMGVSPPQHNGVGNISTPPRSPTKSSFMSTPLPAQTPARDSPSPHRVVAQVPSTILEQPLVEEAAAIGDDDGRRAAALSARDCESIRVYADSDVYALLADVESEFTKMSVPNLGEERELHRARSHDLLCGAGRAETPSGKSRAPSPPEKDDVVAEALRAPSPPEKDDVVAEALRAPSPPAKDDVVPEATKGEDAPIFLTDAVFTPQVPQRSLTVA